MKNEKIVGPFHQCLAHYLANNGPEKLATYLGIKIETVKGWKKSLPKGLNMVLSAYFLENLAGEDNTEYRVDELSKLPPAVRNFGKLLFARLLTVEDVLTKYSWIVASRDALSDLFRRPEKRGEITFISLSRLYDEFKGKHPELEGNNIALKPPGPKVAIQPEVVKRVAEPTTPKPPIRGDLVKVDKQSILQNFASIVEMGTQIGLTILSDQLTSDDRYALRVTLLAGGKLAKFADIVNALTSERAREDKNKSTI